jgi:hypothetical protein
MLSMASYSSKPLPQGYSTACCARKRMAFAISLLLVVLYLGVELCTVTAAASPPSDLPAGLPVEVCGDIVDSIWTAENSYYVTCDATLPSDAALTIDPGVEVQFTTGFSLTLAGTLSAIGSPGQPITFTSDEEMPAPGDWSGLHFVVGSSDSQLSWCVVEYATTAVRVYAGPGETVGPAFSDCTMRYNSLYGVLIEGYTSACDAGLAQPTITDCLVEHNGVEEEGGCGIYGYGHGDPDNGCDPAEAGSVGGVITQSIIRQNQDMGICLESERDTYGHGDVWIAIEANAISDNGGQGVQLFGDDPVRSHIENNLIYANAGAGILSDAKHEEAELLVVNNTIAGNADDGVVFHRSAAQVRLTNNIIAENAGYGLVCAGDPVTQAANNDLWANVEGDRVGCLIGPTDISADPRFVDRAAADFHLTFASPCIDAGTSDGAPATDIEGIARPQGEGVDIGAHELWYQRIYLPLTLRE